jgi:hypothetical protein
MHIREPGFPWGFIAMKQDAAQGADLARKAEKNVHNAGV